MSGPPLSTVVKNLITATGIRVTFEDGRTMMRQADGNSLDITDGATLLNDPRELDPTLWAIGSLVDVVSKTRDRTYQQWRELLSPDGLPSAYLTEECYWDCKYLALGFRNFVGPAAYDAMILDCRNDII